jgi:GTP-binding protein
MSESSNFIDYIRIYCRSGKGGAGSKHFLRARSQPKGGPDGGDGGRGGHVILRGNRNLWTLLHLRYTKHIYAENGGCGSGGCSTGANGNDALIEVPLGTIVRNDDTGEIELEIIKHGEEKTLLAGGRGGLGNTRFKSATNQTPRFAQPGEEGIEGWKILELKILADVGLVGFPNAGKSTLLSVVSAAHPKIADYPFTTITPNIGIVNYRDHLSFVMADIPGIIQGAHEGKGLGLRFLRHIERNSVLLFLIPVNTKSIKTEYRILLRELMLYNPELMHKQKLLAITKCDLIEASTLNKLRKKVPEGLDFVLISSVTGLGIEELKDKIWSTINTEEAS